MAETVTAILFACIIVLAVLWHYHQARIDTCKECPHCQRIDHERRQRLERERREQFRRWYGHDPDEKP